MIDELRVYRMHPGKVEEYLALSQNVAIPFRKNDYGKLLGFWTVASGTLSSVVNLWRHESLESREALRARMAQAPQWKDYMSRTHPLNQHQSVRILAPVLPLAPPDAPGNVYELRLLRAKTGHASGLAAELTRTAPMGPGASTIAIWTNLFGEIYEVVCLSAHASIQQSLDGPFACGWEDFMRTHGSIIEDIASHWLLPIPASPLQ